MKQANSVNFVTWTIAVSLVISFMICSSGCLVSSTKSERSYTAPILKQSDGQLSAEMSSTSKSQNRLQTTNASILSSQFSQNSSNSKSQELPDCAFCSKNQNRRQLRQLNLNYLNPEVKPERQFETNTFKGFVDNFGKILSPSLSSGRTFPSLLIMAVAEFIVIFGICLAMLSPVIITLLTMVHFMVKTNLILIG